MKIDETEQDDRAGMCEDNIKKTKDFRDIVSKTRFTFFSTN